MEKLGTYDRIDTSVDYNLIVVCWVKSDREFFEGVSLKVYTDALGVCEGWALGLDGGVGGLDVTGFVEGEEAAGAVVVFYFE